MEFALIIIGIICLNSFIFRGDKKILQMIGCMMSLFPLTLGIIILSRDMAYKEALKGNNIYKMEIKYEMKDSVYIPSDTVFVLINKK